MPFSVTRGGLGAAAAPCGTGLDRRSSRRHLRDRPPRRRPHFRRPQRRRKLRPFGL